MKVFIAGHKGMVGSSLIRNAPKSVELIVRSKRDLDLADNNAVNKLFSEERPDAVILSAAKVGGIAANSMHQRDFLVENLNIQNSVMISAAENSVSNFLFLGSSCIYPKITYQPISETQLMTGRLEATNESYAIAKIAGIRLMQSIFEESGQNYFSLMPTNLYGPGDNFHELDSHVPAALMRKFHEAVTSSSRDVVVWGSGNPRREFMHVDDLSRACWSLLSRGLGGEVINVGTGEDIAIREFAELIAKIIGYKYEIIYDHSKPDGTPRKLLDVSKIHSYGWKHKIILEEGLKQTYSWFVDALAKGEVRGF